MSFWHRTRGTDRHSGPFSSTGTLEAAARAKRARDHLARKRQQERRRLENARRRAGQAERHARTGAWSAWLAFVAAIVLGATSVRFVTSRVLPDRAGLRRVVVQGAETLPTRAIVESAGISLGTPLSQIDPEALTIAIEREPWIESARALLLPTGTLVLSVVEKKAIARWQSDPSSPVELVDQNGTRFPGAIERGGPLPRVEGARRGLVALPPPALRILREIDRHASLAADPSRLTLRLPNDRAGGPGAGREGLDAGTAQDPFGYVLDLGEEGPHVLLGHDFFDQRIARLAALLESAEVQREDARWIDLRYADRAVLRTGSASG